ncbi:hypothetical protein FACS189467_3920 [Bacteroidia bacterium]|nr:hypothetical protein FACS189467_3920 [Bacteroidia bacterium]
MYKYVIDAYRELIPQAQQYGITIWGVDDASSWLNTTSKFYYPLLWNDDFERKPAYNAVYDALK